jgi:hypothetical protein
MIKALDGLENPVSAPQFSVVREVFYFAAA